MGGFHSKRESGSKPEPVQTEWSRNDSDDSEEPPQYDLSLSESSALILTPTMAESVSIRSVQSVENEVQSHQPTPLLISPAAVTALTMISPNPLPSSPSCAACLPSYSAENCQPLLEYRDSFCQLSTPDVPRLNDLVVELKAVDWHELGIQLGVPADRLDKIDEDYDNCDRKLSEVLKYWLRNEEDPSWDKICEALQKIQGFQRIVRGIKIKYCSLNVLRTFTIHRRHGSRPLASSAVPIVSCEVNPDPRVEAAMSDLHRDFRMRVNTIRRSFTCGMVTVDTIKDVLLSELPAGEVKGQVGFLMAQSNHVCRIKETTDIHHLFLYLSSINAWDFLHPQLLEYLVHELGDTEAKTSIQTYKANLIRFRAATKMREMSGWFGNFPEDPTFQKVMLRLGDNWKDRTYQEFEELRISFLRQQVFDKSPLSTCGVLIGSLFVTLFMPKDTNVADAEHVLKLDSIVHFLMENEVSAIYAEGLCLITLRDMDEVIDPETIATCTDVPLPISSEYGSLLSLESIATFSGSAEWTSEEVWI